MSFKRAGDDLSQLNTLRKRRVSDLLANFVPDDEAGLMSNGRYTCLVCSYRPVFDTVDMLVVHRKGKRHLEGMKWFYQKKSKLQREVEKHRQQEYIRAEESVQEASGPAPLLVQTRKITHHALLKATPYSSCHKKTSTKGPKCASGSTGTRLACKPTYQRIPTACTQSAGAPEVPPRPRPDENGRQVMESEAQSQPNPAERRRELEHYLQLKSSGWLRDRSGNWLKDEGVEFDSDEDEPPSLSLNNVPPEKA